MFDTQSLIELDFLSGQQSQIIVIYFAMGFRPKASELIFLFLED